MSFVKHGHFFPPNEGRNKNQTEQKFPVKIPEITSSLVGLKTKKVVFFNIWNNMSESKEA